MKRKALWDRVFSQARMCPLIYIGKGGPFVPSGKKKTVTPKPMSKEVKADVIYAFKNITSNTSDIADAFDITIGQAAAIKAHITMGTY